MLKTFQYPQTKICPRAQNISLFPICILLTSIAEEEYKNNLNTNKMKKLDTRHIKLHQETLEGKEIEHNLKEEEQTENWQHLKEDDTENKKHRNK